jgi:hypothetical protein
LSLSLARRQTDAPAHLDAPAPVISVAATSHLDGLLHLSRSSHLAHGRLTAENGPQPPRHDTRDTRARVEAGLDRRVAAHLLFANLATGRVVRQSSRCANQRGVLLWHELGCCVDADGAARRRLPIASFLLAQQASRRWRCHDWAATSLLVAGLLETDKGSREIVSAREARPLVDEDGTSRASPTLGIWSGPVVSADSGCRNGDGVVALDIPAMASADRTLAAYSGHGHQPPSSDRFSVAELTVRSAQSDRLEVDPLDLGPDAPATAALEVERGPEPRDLRQRNE